MLTLQAKFYQHFDADGAEDVPEQGFGGWQTAPLEISESRTAVVLMHAWDCGTPDVYPGWRRACPWIARAEAICRDVLPPLLAAVRRSPCPLFHVVGGREYYVDFAGYQRTLELAGDSPDIPMVVQDDHLAALQSHRRENTFPGAHNQPDIGQGTAQMGFAAGAEPMLNEYIAKDGHQLGAICREEGINHLIYAGFNLDWCLLMSPGGMIDMSRQGVMCSAFEQAVTAVENKESARDNWVKAIGLWRVSLAFGFVFDCDDFIQAVKA